MRFPRLARCAAAALALLMLATAGSASAAQAAVPAEYSVTDLSTWPGFESTVAAGINESGQIVGTLRQQTLSYFYEAFVWDPLTGLRSLGRVNGRPTSGAAINDNGEVAGTAGGTFEDPGFGFIWFPAGFTRPLPAPPDLRGGSGRAINNARQVAGAIGPYNPYAVRWTPDGNAERLGSFGPSPDGASQGINARGQVVGWARGPGYTVQPFIWDAERGLRELATVDSDKSGQAKAINDLGHAAGWVGPFGSQAALWRDDQVTVIGPGTAEALNNLDQVVGSFYVNRALHAFRYRDGVQIDLNSVIPAGTGIVLTEARGISDSGLIVANGTDAAGRQRAFLLRPVGVASQTR